MRKRCQLLLLILACVSASAVVFAQEATDQEEAVSADDQAGEEAPSADEATPGTNESEGQAPGNQTGEAESPSEAEADTVDSASDPEATDQSGTDAVGTASGSEAASDTSAEPPRVGEFLTVSGTENWEYTLDIDGYPDGKYNLIVRGIDNAGNVYTTPAIDINIDQDSDRPLVSITNPEPESTVRGNLNILGTAVDDDAVERGEGRSSRAVLQKGPSFRM